MRKYIDDTIKRDFLNIAETSKINTITVSQILEPSGINRKTFYKHFDGISDLICNILLDLYSSMQDSPNAVSYWKQSACHVMNFLKENDVFIHRLFQSRYSSEIRLFFHEQLNLATKNYIHTNWQIYEKKLGSTYTLSDEQEHYIIKIYTPFIYAWIEEWFISGMKEPISESIEAIDRLLNGGIFECIAYLLEKPSTRAFENSSEN